MKNSTAAKSNVVNLYSSLVPCGFPSPADDYLETPLDLNKHLIQKPNATFFVRAKGNSMAPTIESGDLLIVDRSKEVFNNALVLATVDGEFTVKRFLRNQFGTFLVPDNTEFKKLDVTEHSDFSIWGVIIHSIKSHT